MINIPPGYEDAHGLVYSSAVILINHCVYTAQKTVQKSISLTAGVPSYSDGGSSSNIQLGFTANIFPSEQALLEGKQPISFRPAGHSEYFNIQLNDPIADEDVIATCEQWLLDNIFTGGE